MKYSSRWKCLDFLRVVSYVNELWDFFLELIRNGCININYVIWVNISLRYVGICLKFYFY